MPGSLTAYRPQRSKKEKKRTTGQLAIGPRRAKEARWRGGDHLRDHQRLRRRLGVCVLAGRAMGGGRWGIGPDSCRIGYVV